MHQSLTKPSTPETGATLMQLLQVSALRVCCKRGLNHCQYPGPYCQYSYNIIYLKCTQASASNLGLDIAEPQTAIDVNSPQQTFVLAGVLSFMQQCFVVRFSRCFPGDPKSPKQVLVLYFGLQSRYYLHTWIPRVW